MTKLSSIRNTAAARREASPETQALIQREYLPAKSSIALSMVETLLSSLSGRPCEWWVGTHPEAEYKAPEEQELTMRRRFPTNATYTAVKGKNKKTVELPISVILPAQAGKLVTPPEAVAAILTCFEIHCAYATNENDLTSIKVFYADLFAKLRGVDAPNPFIAGSYEAAGLKNLKNKTDKAKADRSNFRERVAKPAARYLRDMMFLIGEDNSISVGSLNTEDEEFMAFSVNKAFIQFCSLASLANGQIHQYKSNAIEAIAPQIFRMWAVYRNTRGWASIKVSFLLERLGILPAEIPEDAAVDFLLEGQKNNKKRTLWDRPIIEPLEVLAQDGFLEYRIELDGHVLDVDAASLKQLLSGAVRVKLNVNPETLEWLKLHVKLKSQRRLRTARKTA